MDKKRQTSNVTKVSRCEDRISVGTGVSITFIAHTHHHPHSHQQRNSHRQLLLPSSTFSSSTTHTFTHLHPQSMDILPFELFPLRHFSIQDSSSYRQNSMTVTNIYIKKFQNVNRLN